MLKYIFNFKNFLLFFVLSIFGNVIMGVTFQMYAYITNVALSRDVSNIPMIIAALTLSGLGQFALFTLIEYLKFYMTQDAAGRLRNDIMRKVFELDGTEFHKNDISYYTSILLNDVEIVENSYFASILDICGEFVQMCVMLVFIWFIEWRFIPIILLLSIPSIIQPFVMRGKLSKAGLSVSKKYESYTQSVKEYLENFEILKIFQRENMASKRFSGVVGHFEKSRRNRFVLNSMNATMVIFCMYILKIGITLFLVNGAIKGLVSLAAITALFGFSNQVGNPISCGLNYIAGMSESGEVRKKLLAFLAFNGQKKLSAQESQEIHFLNSIQFQGVSFTYPKQSEEVLKDFSVAFKKGGKYLLLGKNGSGKSTVVRLLAGDYQIYDGGIYFDDVEIRKADSKALRDKMALISQDVFVFHGTVRDNVTLYDDRYSDSQIMNALGQAGLGEFIASLPEGINTFISEDGANFSGGEKQRFSIARAILVNKELLIVDEGTSGLDNIVSAEIERNLLAMDQTVIVISHRVYTSISEYDGIGILENRRLAIFGRYNEICGTQVFKDCMEG